jgi:flagellar biosynthesis/type III secretory pathway protein FliH
MRNLNIKREKSKQYWLAERGREIHDLGPQLNAAVDAVEKLTNQLNEKDVELAKIRAELKNEIHERKLIEIANETKYDQGKHDGFDEGLKKASSAFSKVILNTTTTVTEVNPCFI